MYCAFEVCAVFLLNPAETPLLFFHSNSAKGYFAEIILEGADTKRNRKILVSKMLSMEQRLTVHHAWYILLCLTTRPSRLTIVLPLKTLPAARPD